MRPQHQTLQTDLAYFSLVNAIARLLNADRAAGPARGIPTNVIHEDDSIRCDPLFVPLAVDELGLGPTSFGAFPPDKEILASDTNSAFPACPPLSPLPRLTLPSVEVHHALFSAQRWGAQGGTSHEGLEPDLGPIWPNSEEMQLRNSLTISAVLRRNAGESGETSI